MSLPANINISQARLPATYEQAKAALANCARIDECKDWADKAAALASYAKQADDDEMMKMAVRVRDRAIRRAGELLKQVEPAKNQHDAGARDGGGPSSRKDAGKNAGMSERQVKTALRVANVPEAEFERQVESRYPPTVSKLAEQGKKATPRPAIDLKGRDPAEFNRAMHYVGEWESVARTLTGLGHDAALPILTTSEAARLRAAIASIDAITDRIITRI